MEEKLLREYARLIAQIGAHVNKGDEVWINAGLDQPEFVYMVVEECYKAGAKYVETRFEYEEMARLHYKYVRRLVLTKTNSSQPSLTAPCSTTKMLRKRLIV